MAPPPENAPSTGRLEQLERWGLRLWDAVAPFLPHSPAAGDADRHVK